MKKYSVIFVIPFLILSCFCEPCDEQDLEMYPYNPEYFIPEVPPTFPQFEQPEDNLMTREGVELGRFLFYDTILSGDGTMSCSSCHLPSGSFTDNLAVSTGIDGVAGTRSSMSLLNSAYFFNGLFWDGRVSTLEEQALLPVEDPIELHNKWPNVENKLRESDRYPKMFREAFGIVCREEITKELAAKAIAQFERSLVSSPNSKWDRVLANVDAFTDQELLGFDMFFDVNDQLKDAECNHCHNAPLFGVNEYFNNGLDAAATLDDFEDLGHGMVTGINLDNGKFRAPSLRNIELTAPYMHDGRFATLEEVFDHYNSGGHLSPNRDPLILELGFNEEEKAAMIAFLKTLTDTSIVNNPAYQSPF